MTNKNKTNKDGSATTKDKGSAPATPPPVIPGEPMAPKGVNSTQPKDTKKEFRQEEPEWMKRGRSREEARNEGDKQKRRRAERPQNDDIRERTREERDNSKENTEKKNSDNKLFKMLAKMQAALEKMSPRNSGGTREKPQPFNQYDKGFMSMPLEQRRKIMRDKQQKYDEATRNRTVYGRIGGVGRGVEAGLNYFAGSADDTLQRKALHFATGSMIKGAKNWARRVEEKRGVSFARNFEVPDEEGGESKGGSGSKNGKGGGDFDPDVKSAILSVKTNTDEIVKAVKSIDTQMSQNALDKLEQDKEAAEMNNARRKASEKGMNNKEGGGDGEGGGGGGIVGDLLKLYGEYRAIKAGGGLLKTIFKKVTGFGGDKVKSLSKIGGNVKANVKGFFTGNPKGAVQDAAGKWRLPKGVPGAGQYTSAPKGNIFKRAGNAIANAGGRGLSAIKTAGGKGLSAIKTAGGKGLSKLSSIATAGGKALAASVPAMKSLGKAGLASAKLGLKGLPIVSNVIDSVSAIKNQGNRSVEDIQSRGGFASSAIQDFGNNASFGLADKFNKSKTAERLNDKIFEGVESAKGAYRSVVDSTSRGIESGAKMLGRASDKIKEWTGLGSIATQYETGGRGAGTVSTGKGDHGGASYGSYQLSKDTLKKFLKDSGYGNQFGSMQPGSPQFNAKWKEIADNDPNFGKAQHEFIKKTHYDEMIENLKKKGIDLSTKGPAVQEVVFSTSVQYGSGKTSLFEQALKGKDVKKMTDSEIVGALQDTKAARVQKDFKSSSSNVQQGVANRIASEKKSLMALADGGAKAKPQTAGTNGAARTTMATAQRDVRLVAGSAPSPSKGASPPAKGASGSVPDKVAAQVPITRNPDSTVKRIQQSEMAGRAV